MNHLYESKDGLIHLCEGGEAAPCEYVVWTVCEIDVPANQSFKNKEMATCPKCLKYNKGNQPDAEKFGDFASKSDYYDYIRKTDKIL